MYHHAAVRHSHKHAHAHTHAHTHVIGSSPSPSPVNPPDSQMGCLMSGSAGNLGLDTWCQASVNDSAPGLLWQSDKQNPAPSCPSSQKISYGDLKKLCINIPGNTLNNWTVGSGSNFTTGLTIACCPFNA